MKHRRIAAAVAALALVGAAPTASTATSSSPEPAVHAACTSAKIGGQRKCIARGQFCARAHQRDYKRYGYSCSKRDRNGRYHLV
jgi:curli biogenesis system outer membrane secretion channel CsgG